MVMTQHFKTKIQIVLKKIPIISYHGTGFTSMMCQ